MMGDDVCRGVKIKPRPGSNHLLSTNADGFHSTDTEIGTAPVLHLRPNLDTFLVTFLSSLMDGVMWEALP